MSSLKSSARRARLFRVRLRKGFRLGKVVVGDGDDDGGQGNIEIQLVIIITTIKPTIQASYNRFKPVKVRLSWYGCQSDEIE